LTWKKVSLHDILEAYRRKINNPIAVLLFAYLQTDSHQYGGWPIFFRLFRI